MSLRIICLTLIPYQSRPDVSVLIQTDLLIGFSHLNYLVVICVLDASSLTHLFYYTIENVYRRIILLMFMSIIKIWM